MQAKNRGIINSQHSMALLMAILLVILSSCSNSNNNIISSEDQSTKTIISNIFPIKPGNQWIYAESHNRYRGITTFKIDSTRSSGDSLYFFTTRRDSGTLILTDAFGNDSTRLYESTTHDINCIFNDSVHNFIANKGVWQTQNGWPFYYESVRDTQYHYHESYGGTRYHSEFDQNVTISSRMLSVSQGNLRANAIRVAKYYKSGSCNAPGSVCMIDSWEHSADSTTWVSGIGYTRLDHYSADYPNPLMIFTLKRLIQFNEFVIPKNFL